MGSFPRGWWPWCVKVSRIWTSPSRRRPPWSAPCTLVSRVCQTAGKIIILVAYQENKSLSSMENNSVKWCIVIVEINFLTFGLEKLCKIKCCRGRWEEGSDGFQDYGKKVESTQMFMAWLGFLYDNYELTLQNKWHLVRKCKYQWAIVV